jgi:hypothetical protein
VKAHLRPARAADCVGLGREVVSRLCGRGIFFQKAYAFAVYAVDVDTLGIDADATPAFMGFNLFGHTLGRAVIVPIYEA